MTMETSEARLNILRDISAQYQELNGTHYDTLDQPPSPMEFLRLVHISRPVVIKGFAVDATSKWTDEYLIKRLGDSPVSVAVTPNGRADAVTVGSDGKRYFAEPQVQKMRVRDFLDMLGPQSSHNAGDVYYLQSQNGNLFRTDSVTGSFEEFSEFAALRSDVPDSVPWASEALDTSPDAVNIWIGDSRSVTSIHSDPYENIYFVVRGTKQFTLLPPTEGWCLREQMYPHASYTRKESHGAFSLTPTVPTQLIRWSSVQNPLTPGSLPPEASPLQITLEAGDSLYLPAGWWHYVRQSDVTVSVNWWYDVEVRGMSWVWLQFLRGDSVPDGNEE